MFQVKLKDYLVTGLDFSKAKDAELAWIDGCIDLSSTKPDVDEEMYDDENIDESTRSRCYKAFTVLSIY